MRLAVSNADTTVTDVVVNPDRFLPSRQLIRQQLDTGKLGEVGLVDPEAHAAAAVLADAVTLLSTNWTDRESLINASAGPQLGVRPAVTTYYRVAIAGGKNKTFPNPAFSGPGNFGFGTDGGVHNFLRFLEDWAGPGGVQQTLYYKGSLVSLYYSEYATGTFKCCTYAVYTPPKRKYVFDPLFAQPQNLPPGTPMFRDVDNLSYRQDFTPY